MRASSKTACEVWPPPNLEKTSLVDFSILDRKGIISTIMV
jgi:hypothetical protein